MDCPIAERVGEFEAFAIQVERVMTSLENKLDTISFKIADVCERMEIMENMMEGIG